MRCGKKYGMIMNKNSLITLMFLLAVSLLFGKLITATESLYVMIPAIAMVFIMIMLIKPEYGLIFLLFSMMLSPEITVGKVPGRDIVARVDDILISVMFFTWLVKTAVNKELGLLVKTPLNKIMLSLIALWILSTCLGIVRGNVSALKGFFYLLRYVEYYMLFFLVVNNIKSRKQVKTLVLAGLITCVIVVIFGYTQIGSGARVTAPFDVEGGGEPASLGGYFLIIMSLCLAFFINSDSPRTQLIGGGMFCFMVPPFLYTLSRGSWLAFFVLIPAMLILTKKRKVIFLLLILFGCLVSSVVLPKRVIDRVKFTFSGVGGGSQYNFGNYNLKLEGSSTARIITWKRAFLEQFPRRPIIGHGISGVGLSDAQLPLVIGETGFVGFVLFLMLLAVMVKTAMNIYKTEKESYFKSLALGFLGVFIALMVHGITVSTFMIIRIMEPFWFLTAIVMSIPRLKITGDIYEYQP
jgi:O-antigen ligase